MTDFVGRAQLDQRDRPAVFLVDDFNPAWLHRKRGAGAEGDGKFDHWKSGR
jgi:hypothetical protein